MSVHLSFCCDGNGCTFSATLPLDDDLFDQLGGVLVPPRWTQRRVQESIGAHPSSGVLAPVMTIRRFVFCEACSRAGEVTLAVDERVRAAYESMPRDESALPGPN